MGFRELNLGRNCKNCFGVYACCFVNINTATYFNLFLCPFKPRDMSIMTRVPILFFNFDLLHAVHSRYFNVYYREGAFRSPLSSL